MKKLLFATVALGAFAAPASAATVYNVADLGGPFSYATYTGGFNFTPFTAGCPARSDLEPCFQGVEGAGAAHIVSGAPVGSLLVHPGGSANTTVLFTAPTSSLYEVDGSATLSDPAAGGDGVLAQAYFNGGLIGPAFALTPASRTAVFPGGRFFLAAGQQIGLVISPNTNNNFDSVSLVGTISAVPEPATWAMMIMGFGLIGAAMRRSAKPKVNVAFA